MKTESTERLFQHVFFSCKTAVNIWINILQQSRNEPFYILTVFCMSLTQNTASTDPISFTQEHAQSSSCSVESEQTFNTRSRHGTWRPVLYIESSPTRGLTDINRTSSKAIGDGTARWSSSHFPCFSWTMICSDWGLSLGAADYSGLAPAGRSESAENTRPAESPMMKRPQQPSTALN